MSARILAKLEVIENACAVIRAELNTDAPFEPEWYRLALAELGVQEWAGSESNPRVEWYQTFTTYDEENHGGDAVPWCSAFVCAMAPRPTRSAAARSWLSWGEAIGEPEVGCVVVLWRGKSDNGTHGHVGFFAGYSEDGELILLGGNQATPEAPQGEVCFRAYPRRRVLGYRWPSEVRA